LQVIKIYVIQICNSNSSRAGGRVVRTTRGKSAIRRIACAFMAQFFHEKFCTIDTNEFLEVEKVSSPDI
jgi:hypothetical protein